MRKTSTTLWVLNLCQGYLDETNPSVWYDHVLSQPRSKKVLGSNHPLARMWSLYVLPASLRALWLPLTDMQSVNACLMLFVMNWQLVQGISRLCWVSSSPVRP